MDPRNEAFYLVLSDAGHGRDVSVEWFWTNSCMETAWKATTFLLYSLFYSNYLLPFPYSICSFFFFSPLLVFFSPHLFSLFLPSLVAHTNPVQDEYAIEQWSSRHLRRYVKTSYINQNEPQEPLELWTSSDHRTHEDSSQNWGTGMRETSLITSLTGQRITDKIINHIILLCENSFVPLLILYDINI
jgi:hypothetical protein